MDLRLPKPEDRPDPHTLETVFRGKAYAEQWLETNCDRSPLTRDFLKLYDGACKQYIVAHANGFSGCDQWAFRDAVRRFELKPGERLWLESTLQEHLRQAEQELLELRKMQMYSRYGDYLRLIYHELRVHSEAAYEQGQNTMGTNSRWTKISADIVRQNAEREERHAHPARYIDPWGVKFPELEFLERAAKRTSLNFQQCLWAIQEYDKRNNLFRNDMEENIAKGDVGAVARTLHADLADISVVLDESLQNERVMLIAIIDTLIST